MAGCHPGTGALPCCAYGVRRPQLHPSGCFWIERIPVGSAPCSELNFSPYTFQSLTLTSVTTLLPCWKLGYRVVLIWRNSYPIAEPKEVPLTQLNSGGGTWQLYIYLWCFLWPPSHLSFILLEIFISVVALKRYNYFVSALLKHGHLSQLQLQV